MPCLRSETNVPTGLLKVRGVAGDDSVAEGVGEGQIKKTMSVADRAKMMRQQRSNRRPRATTASPSPKRSANIRALKNAERERRLQVHTARRDSLCWPTNANMRAGM